MTGKALLLKICEALHDAEGFDYAEMIGESLIVVDDDGAVHRLDAYGEGFVSAEAHPAAASEPRDETL